MIWELMFLTVYVHPGVITPSPILCLYSEYVGEPWEILTTLGELLLLNSLDPVRSVVELADTIRNDYKKPHAAQWLPINETTDPRLLGSSMRDVFNGSTYVYRLGNINMNPEKYGAWVNLVVLDYEEIQPSGTVTATISLRGANEILRTGIELMRARARDTFQQGSSYSDYAAGIIEESKRLEILLLEFEIEYLPDS